MPPKAKPTKDTSTANLGFEQKLWLTADSRSAVEPKRSEDSPARFSRSPGQTAEGNRSNNMDAAEPSGANRVERDSLHEVQPARAGAAAHGKQTATGSPKGERGGANQYKAENVFWGPADARWSHPAAESVHARGASVTYKDSLSVQNTPKGG